ncbi:hypothetical protein BRADI_1g58017v3 [Brachypodium distachyon]|uniref:Uncharacterized protein n=1 Tax=Brachypodium distachyon TaxID=15368 RepID=A0A2K2DS74_BRADI|nr:hypothetical protein BRADI_1g58017v3 [Brachypodium distachyon]
MKTQHCLQLAEEQQQLEERVGNNENHFWAKSHASPTILPSLLPVPPFFLGRIALPRPIRPTELSHRPWLSNSNWKIIWVFWNGRFNG